MSTPDPVYTLTVSAEELAVISGALASLLAASRTPYTTRITRTLLRRVGWEAAGWPVACDTGEIAS